MIKKTGKSTTETLRERAESLLKNKQSETNTQLSEADILKLIHELQIHQFELELQNEGYVQLIAKAEECADRFRSTIENTQAGYFFIDNEGLFQDVNQAWLYLYKYESLDEVIGKHFTKVQQLDDIESAIEFVDGIKSGNPDYMIGDFSRKCKDGSIGYHSFSARPVYSKNEIIGIEGFIIDITKQKSIEKELKREKEEAEKNEELLRLINNTTFDQIYSYDIENRFTSANKTLCENLKLSADDIIGKSYWELGFPEENCRKWDELHRQVYSEGKKTEIVSTPMPDGTIQYFEVNLFVLKDSDGIAVGLAGINRNITASKLAETELIKAKNRAEESEERFNLAMNATKDGLYDWNLITNEIYYSPGWKSMLGYTDDELPNDFTVWEKLTEQKDVKRSWEMQQKVINKQLDRFEIEFKMKHKDGHWINVLSRAEALFNDEGKAVRIIGVHTDITERLSIQKMVHYQASLIDQVNSAIITIDFENTILSWNRYAEKLYQWKEAEVIRKNIIDILAPKELLIETKQNFDRLNKDGHWEGDYYVLRKDGTTIPAHILNTYLKDEAGEKIGFIGISTDISFRKQYELELVKAKEKAEESDRLKTEFINNMSHEIRTPMNGILGFSKMLNKANLSDAKRKHFISIIQNSGNQLMRVIDDIIEISKLGTKQVVAIEKETCLNDLFLELFSIFDVKAKENKTPLYFKKGLSDRESTILTDSTKLNKVISNLLENALKFTNTGFVEFGYQKINSNLEIYVKDTGIGISADKQEKVFERFSKGENNISKNIGGLGLGLSIAKENAELLDGKIMLKSEKGKGTTFFVTIPYKPIISDIEKNNSNTIEEKEKQYKYTILIAEDEEVNYLYVETLLEDEIDIDCNILHAKNGKEAVDMCKENMEIGFVLMDLKMPCMNGLEATKLIKEFRPDLPIVAQTAYTASEDRAKAISAGCDDFISKPINEEALGEIINKYLKKDKGTKMKV